MHSRFVVVQCNQECTSAHIFLERNLNVFQQAARLGSKGLQWTDLRDDPNCGMGTVLIIFVIEWPLFLLISLYLDQVFIYLWQMLLTKLYAPTES